MNNLVVKAVNCLLLVFGTFLLSAQTPHVSSGSIQHFEKFPSQYVTARNVDVWLPEGYTPRRKYAVLYMHDGQMLFDSAMTWNHQEWGVDETVSKLLKEKKIRRCIVVAIWNNNATRHSDYFPQKAFELLPKQAQDTLLQHKPDGKTALFSAGIQSDNYLRFLVSELKPFIDSHFSTKKDRKNTFIAGSSMGGLISLYAICEYPKVFGGAACLSTHWPGIFTLNNNPIPEGFIRYMEAHLPAPKTHKIYFDYGTETLDALYEPFQKQADQVMIRKKYTAGRWISLKYEHADHSEKAWARRLHIPLEFLL